MDEMTPEFDLPGFRFHPTEEELLDFYLKNVVYGKRLRFDIIGYLNIYHHDPWDLPGLAKIGEREWYFFVPRDRKHGSGGRPNRTTEAGFWKATGSDRKIVSLSDPKRVIGLRKTLVFYTGRAPKGCKTDWVMNEYRLPDSCPLPRDIVLCKIYRKATSLKVLEQRAAMEEEMKPTHAAAAAASQSPSPISSPIDTMSIYCQQQENQRVSPPAPLHPILFKKEVLEEMDTGGGRDNSISTSSSSSSSTRNGKAKDEMKGPSSLQLPMGITELQVPKLNMDWNLDTPWLSPWLQNLTPYANLLNMI